MNPDVTKLERRARELLSPDVYDFYAGGAGREATLRANQKAWRRVQFLPRVLRDVSAVDTSVVLGSPLDLTVRTPLAVAPTAFHRLAHPDAELASAGAAAQAGALFVLSIRSTCRIEDVGAAVAAAGGSWWFQVYLMHDLDITAGLVRRAAAAGAQALVLTGDTPYVGRKARIADAPISGDDFLVNIGPLADLAPAELAASVTPAHIGWLSEISGGLPVLVKGVLRGDDAAACVDAGAAGVIVSNHGGRQLDRAVPTAVALPAVAARLAAGRCWWTAGSAGRRMRGRAGPRCPAGIPRPARAVGPGLRRSGRRAGPAGWPHRRSGARHGAGRSRLSGRPGGYRRSWLTRWWQARPGRHTLGV